MTDLKELIERVERATGPDRELDGEIDRFIMWGPHSEWGNAGGGYERHKVTGETRQFGLWTRADPSYTASIDAALALTERMLPDVCVAVTSNVTDAGRRGACEMWRWAANKFDEPRERNKRNGHEHMHQNVAAATPALAILYALLRALQEQEK